MLASCEAILASGSGNGLIYGLGMGKDDATRTCTRIRLSLFMNVFSLRILASSDATVMMSPTIKWRIPCLRVSTQEIAGTKDHPTLSLRIG